MFTMFDFVTKANGLAYLLALGFVAGFIIYWEVMKPRPFRALMESFMEDVRFMKERGMTKNMQLVKNVALAPVVAAMYFAALPLMFAQGMAETAREVAGAMAAAGWNPVEAYLAGKRNAKKRPAESAKKEEGK